MGPYAEVGTRSWRLIKKANKVRYSSKGIVAKAVKRNNLAVIATVKQTASNHIEREVGEECMPVAKLWYMKGVD